MDWFLYDNGLRHEKVNMIFSEFYLILVIVIFIFMEFNYFVICKYMWLTLLKIVISGA